MASRSDVHHQAGRYIKDIVYAANDGIITTFAVVAGVVGADQAVSIVIIMGLANLIADGISMASGNYLGSHSEYQYYLSEKENLEKLVKHQPSKSRQALRTIYARKGFRGSFLTEIIDKLMVKKSIWSEELLADQMKSRPPDAGQPIRAALVTFVSFITFGFIPLVPYFFGVTNSFLVSVAATALALFLVGSLRSIITGRSWFLAGLEMLFIGAVASTSAYVVGYLIMSIISS